MSLSEQGHEKLHELLRAVRAGVPFEEMPSIEDDDRDEIVAALRRLAALAEAEQRGEIRRVTLPDGRALIVSNDPQWRLPA